jgi:AcrR family transcriptional regulator
MSPARARTSNDEVVSAGRALLEAGGLEAVTMHAVAERVGVRAPSLYKRFPSRAALIAAIGESTLEDLERSIRQGAADPDPAAGLRSVATTYRAFAHANPRSYELLFMGGSAEARPSAQRYAWASAPLLALTERLSGPDRALEAARLVTAFANGFVSMELSGSFQLGGDLDDAYRYGVDVLVEALGSRHPDTRSEGAGATSAT